MTNAIFRQAYDAAEGLLIIPGGCLSKGEMPAGALEREILEETGIIATADSLIAIRFSRKDWWAIYTANYISGEPISDENENSEANFIGRINVKIKVAGLSDISAWIALSKEYDKYVQEIVSDIAEWYEGNETSIPFKDYMKAKIHQNEAFMVVDGDDICCGIIAISKTNNRITFFAVSHRCDFTEVGKVLIDHALSELNISEYITTNIIKSNAEQIQKQCMLFNQYDFAFSLDSIENGVPVNCLKRNPNS